MTLKQRIEALKEKHTAILKAKMILTQLEGEFNQDFKLAMRDLNLPEGEVSLIQIIDKALNHSEIKIA